MTSLLVDTSTLIKWFHTEGEAEVVQARAVRSAHVNGVIQAHILDLAVYEVGNVLIRALHWNAVDVADQLDDLLAIVGPPLAMSQHWLRDASHLAQKHALSYYDACWAAAAAALKVSLVSADRLLLRAGLAESPGAAATRLRLS